MSLLRLLLFLQTNHSNNDDRFGKDQNHYESKGIEQRIPNGIEQHETEEWTNILLFGKIERCISVGRENDNVKIQTR